MVAQLTRRIVQHDLNGVQHGSPTCIGQPDQPQRPDAGHALPQHLNAGQFLQRAQAVQRFAEAVREDAAHRHRPSGVVQMVRERRPAGPPAVTITPREAELSVIVSNAPLQLPEDFQTIIDMQGCPSGEAA